MSAQMTAEQYAAAVEALKADFAKQIQDVKEQVLRYTLTPKVPGAEHARVHVCSAFKEQADYNGRFPGQKPGQCLVPVSYSANCPYCKAPTSGMDFATPEQVRHLEGI